MATASSPWTPAPGRHNVSIGSSLGKALKARKGQVPQKPKQGARALPERDFYTLRYNHKPPSIDSTKPGTIEAIPGAEVTTVRVERPTTNANEVIVWKGEEKPAKEWECVLIYDEEKQTFTLEKLDSLVNLNYEGKALPRARPTASPIPTPAPVHTPARTAADELEAQIEAGFAEADVDADADGEPDPSFSAKQEEEEEEIPIARIVPPPPKQQPKPIPPLVSPTSKPKARPLKKTAPVPSTVPAPSPVPAPASVTAAVVPPPKSRGTGGSKPVKPRAAVPPKRTLEHADDEGFEINVPLAPAAPPPSVSKRARASSPPPAAMSASSFTLALPTPSGPDPLAHQGLYASTSTSAIAPAAAADSDDDWDEIIGPSDPTPARAAPQDLTIPLQGQTQAHDEEEDDGLDFLERELLGEDEPEDADGDEDEEIEEVPVPVPPVRVGGGPVSMNQFVTGETAVIEDYDDEYSSSEESEED
ncbi:RNA polymerase II transcription elongation factor-domain-containing protein [Gloeopeniophorella convolvens]|nr:RNA polymerase II transcription elongation factor-domain-containing protein [Gloeopeniophorella convolvens]